MGWTSFVSNDGIYQVNWDGLARILRSCARADAMNRYSREVLAEKHWIGPDLWSVEVDWDKVRQETSAQSEAALRKFHACAARSMRSEIHWLISLMEQAEDDRDAFEDRMSSAQHKTMQNVEQSVHRGEVGMEIAKGIRDLSAEVVMVGAVEIEMPIAAAAFLTTSGSWIKGFAVYTDTGRADHAIATFSTNLLFGALDLKVGKVAEKLSTTGKVGVGILWAKVKGAAEIPKGLIEGKDLKEAASAGAVKVGAATATGAGVEMLKSALKAKHLDGLVIPVEVALNKAQDRGGELLARAGENGTPHSQQVNNPHPMRLPHPHKNHHLMDTFLYDRSVIDQTALRKVGSGVGG